MNQSDRGTYDTDQALEIPLSKLKSIFADLGCSKLYIKSLAPNDNSKNQPYFGGHLTDLSFLPTKDIEASMSTSTKTSSSKRRIKYKANLNLAWVDANGTLYEAPNSKLIYYPQYPEVRFSGFLKSSSVAMSKWMDPKKRGRCSGRWLILGVGENHKIYTYLATPQSSLAKEFESVEFTAISTVFYLTHTTDDKSEGQSPRAALLDKLKDVHNMGWIQSQKLSPDLIAKPYQALNGGGYTLESILGIVPNSIAEPDYLGWEVKQFGVKRFPRTGAKTTTLMTPEPNGGIYTELGLITFIKTYGYPDKNNQPDRLNFGGKHTVGNRQNLTNLTLSLVGFDSKTKEIIDANGQVALIDDIGNIAAGWGFPKLMEHWKRKHSQAVFVPCCRQKDENKSFVEYCYGSDVELGTGTTFEKFLNSMHRGEVYYDPGIKLEKVSTHKPVSKRRSQFRVNHKNLNGLYEKYEFVNVLNA